MGQSASGKSSGGWRGAVGRGCFNGLSRAAIVSKKLSDKGSIDACLPPSSTRSAFYPRGKGRVDFVNLEGLAQVR